MYIQNYRNFLTEYNVPTGGLLAFYSFTGYSGNVIYNDKYNSAHTDGTIDPRKYPLFLACSGDGVVIQDESIKLNAESMLRMSEFIDLNEWTVFLTFKHDAYSTGIGYTLFSTISEDFASGLHLGVTDSNRIYIEYPDSSTSGSSTVHEILPGELNNKNIVSIGRKEKYLDIINHDPLNNVNSIYTYKADRFTDSNVWNFGGNIYDYKASGLSGYIDRITVHSGYLTTNQRNNIYEALISTGIDSTTVSISSSSYNKITGYAYESVVTGTGITGYEFDGVDDLDLKCSTIEIASISGLTGELTANQISFLTSTDNVTVNNRSVTARKIYYNDEYLALFGNDTVIFTHPYEFDENDTFEIYSYRENFKPLNLEPVYFAPTKDLIVDLDSATDPFNLYLNGIFQVKGSGTSTVNSGDYIYGSYNVDSDEYYENTVDDFIYDSYSSDKIFLDVPNETGEITLTDSIYTGKDIFFNGQKLMSGIGYSGVAGNIVVDLSGHGTGKLYFVSHNNENFDYYTGSSTKSYLATYGLTNPMIWVNGLRQKRLVDYLILNNNSLVDDGFFGSADGLTAVYSGDENILNL